MRNCGVLTVCCSHVHASVGIRHPAAGLEIGEGHDPEAGDDEPGEEAEKAEQTEEEFEGDVFDAACPVADL